MDEQPVGGGGGDTDHAALKSPGRPPGVGLRGRDVQGGVVLALRGGPGGGETGRQQIRKSGSGPGGS